MLQAALLYSLLALTSARVSTKKGQTSTGRIVGGVPTTIDKHPYQASLQIFIDPNRAHICGAAIINDSWALTAGHCVQIKTDHQLKLMVGSTYVEEEGSLHNVTQIIVHEHYDFPQNDIALLKVSPPFIFSRYVQPIPMQTSSLPPGTIVHVTGWGTTTEEVETYSNQLRLISVPLVDINECKKIYDLGLTSRHMCAGREGKDSCQGDSGGPMVAYSKLVGIVSFGTGCARPGIPGVYTKVSSFVNWVSARTGIEVKSSE